MIVHVVVVVRGYGSGGGSGGGGCGGGVGDDGDYGDDVAQISRKPMRLCQTIVPHARSAPSV
jgi:hypothetical protein